MHTRMLNFKHIKGTRVHYVKKITISDTTLHFNCFTVVLFEIGTWFVGLHEKHATLSGK